MYKSFLPFMSPEVAPFISLIILIDLVLKGITLFKSAQKDQKIWFVALLLVNSMGILPIIYLILNKDIQFTPSKKPSLKPTKKRGN